jgi:hypothetical protein
MAMNTSPTKAERLHLGKVKALPCSVCGAPGPSEAHHISQSQVYTCVALCQDCHRGSLNGWHGQKRAWILRKTNELEALNETLKGLLR